MLLGDPLLTNNIEPSCSILHSEKARRELALSHGKIEQKRLSPIVFSSTFRGAETISSANKVKDVVYVLLRHAMVFDVEEA